MRRPETQSFHSLKKTKEEKPDWATAHPTPFHISISTGYLYHTHLSPGSWAATVRYCTVAIPPGRQADRQAGRLSNPPNPPIPTLIYPPNTLGSKQRASQTRGFNVTKERMPMGKEETKGKTDEREGKKREQQDRTGEGRGAALAHLA